MAKIKPILFNTEMVRAILEDRKTVTRRVVKPQHLRVLDSQYHKEHPETPDNVLLERLCEPPFLPGNILYVRETWERSMAGTYLYKATDTPLIHDGWRPSIHMPKEAARIFLRVTDVRVERLQDITAGLAAIRFRGGGRGQGGAAEKKDQDAEQALTFPHGQGPPVPAPGTGPRWGRRNGSGRQADRGSDPRSAQGR